MDLSKNSLKIATDRIFLIGFLDILFLALPGIALVYFFNLTLFLSLDWIKLVLLSMSAVTPFVLFNAISIVLLDDSPAHDDRALFFQISIGIFVTGIILYITLALSYFGNISFREAAIFVCVIETIIVAIAAYKDRARTRKTVSK